MVKRMSARNGGGGDTYVKITRSDVKAFDTKAWEIIRDAQDMGWTFRLSSRGHAIGRAPDGKATMSVANRYDNKQSGANARAELERWKKQHETKALSRAKLEGAIKTIAGNVSRSLIQTYSQDSPDDVPEPVKVVLARMADDDDVAYFMADRIAEGRRPPLILTNDLDSGVSDITDASKPWRVQWVVADPDTHKVVGFGGPKMTRENAEYQISCHLAVQARAKAEAKQAAIDAATPKPKPQPVTKPQGTYDTSKMETFMKMYACPEPDCEAVFERVQSLASHKFQKHQAKVTCRWCARDYTKAALNRHQPACEKNPHRNDTFVCGRCDGEFKITGKGRHESTCKRLNPEQLAEKRASNFLRRGLPVPADAPIGVRNLAKHRGTLAPAAAPSPTTTTAAEAAMPVAGTGLAQLAASLPQVADPLGALMNLLAEVEELRSQRPDDLRRQIETLTTERDEARKRAEEAEGKLSTLKSVFG